VREGDGEVGWRAAEDGAGGQEREGEDGRMGGWDVDEDERERDGVGSQMGRVRARGNKTKDEREDKELYIQSSSDLHRAGCSRTSLPSLSVIRLLTAVLQTWCR
jgi:hypothetical protein